MKTATNITVIFALALINFYLGIYVGEILEHNKKETRKQTPEMLVKEVSRLYQSKVVLPDSVLIGFSSGHQAYIFRYCDAERGLEYVGLFEEVER